MTSAKVHSGSGDPRKTNVLWYRPIVENKRESKKHWSCLHVWDFRRKLDPLEKWGYTTITFKDHHLSVKGELTLPRKSVVLTFDGPCFDSFRVMFPTLQKLKRVVKEPGYTIACSTDLGPS